MFVGDGEGELGVRRCDCIQSVCACARAGVGILETSNSADDGTILSGQQFAVIVAVWEACGDLNGLAAVLFSVLDCVRTQVTPLVVAKADTDKDSSLSGELSDPDLIGSTALIVLARLVPTLTTAPPRPSNKSSSATPSPTDSEYDIVLTNCLTLLSWEELRNSTCARQANALGREVNAMLGENARGKYPKNVLSKSAVDDMRKKMSTKGAKEKVSGVIDNLIKGGKDAAKSVADGVDTDDQQFMLIHLVISSPQIALLLQTSTGILTRYASTPAGHAGLVDALVSLKVLTVK